jgi:hypothetical protein
MDIWLIPLLAAIIFELASIVICLWDIAGSLKKMVPPS